MTLTDYNGFTGEERDNDEIDEIYEKAISDGKLKPLEETKCVICGQDKGIRVYHAENYFPEKIVDSSFPMCFKCHARVHGVKLTNPQKYREYL